jgi:transposase InsO family protein
MILGDN